MCEIHFDFETMLQNIRCFIVIIVRGSFRRQGIVVSFFTLEYEVVKKLKNLPFNAVKLNFVAIFVFFVTAASFI